uniref:Inhibitor of apoptosis 3 n=1 Tax=Lymantria dispar multicapsid nuclear polyhedrosis virus TaxID=10449 RepID=A0A1B1MR00_NPVLD|nr:inhibitor of apoptosis 3 [Lymantria dispar multiple nucleopolyhedrovirus]
MENEQRRLATFADWPQHHVLTPAELAYAGFYCVGRADYVRCAYCRIEIGNWSVGSDAMSDHKRYSPSCEFIRSLLKRPLEPFENDSVDIMAHHHNNYYYNQKPPPTPPPLPQPQPPAPRNPPEISFCAVCLDASREVMFAPCHHVVCCERCASAVDACVVCRTPIERRVRVFLH